MPTFKLIRKSVRYKYVTLYETPEGLRYFAKYYNKSKLFKTEARAANFVKRAIKEQLLCKD